MKTCTACGETKPLDAFAVTGFAYPNRPRMRRNTCKTCVSAAQRGKVCPVCGKYKARKRYYANAAQSDGMSVQCKACQDAFTLEWRQRNKERHNAYRREYWRKRRRGLAKISAA